MSSRYQYAPGFQSTPPHMLPPFQSSPSSTPRSGRASPAFPPMNLRQTPAPIQTKPYYANPPSFLTSGARSAPLLPSFAVGRQLPPPVPTTRGPPSPDIGSYSVSRGSPGKYSLPAPPQHSFPPLPPPGYGSPGLAKRRSIDTGLGQSRHATHPPTAGSYSSSRRVGQAPATELRQPPSASASRISHFRTASPIPLQPSQPMPVHAPHRGLGTPRPLPSSHAPSSQFVTAPPRSHGSSLAGPPFRPGVGTVNPADVFPAYPSFSSFSQLPQYTQSSSSPSPTSSLSRPGSALGHSRPASPGGRPRTPSQLQPPRRRGIDAVDPDSPVSSLRSSPISSKPPAFSPPPQYQLPPMRPSPPSAGRNVRARAASLSTASAPDFGRYYESSGSDSFEDEYKPAQRKESVAPKGEYQRRKSFSNNELRVLAAAWNAGHYYPASSLVENICIATGLTRPQVRGWFANRRQRASEYEKVLIHECGQRNGIAGIAF